MMMMMSTEYLDGVETADDSSVLNVDVWWRMCVATLGVGPAAALSGELSAHLQRQPPGVLAGHAAAATSQHHGRLGRRRLHAAGHRRRLPRSARRHRRRPRRGR